MSSRVKYYLITQGQVLATWYILYLTSQYKKLDPGKAISIALSSGKMGGSFPAKAGLKICIDYGLVRFEDAQLMLTEISIRNIVPHCGSEEPNLEVLRAILLHIIAYHHFEWLIFYDPDPEIFRTYLLDRDAEWTNLLDSAKLFDFSDEDVNNWWNKVLTKYEDYKEKLKKAIGDVGEKLTYHYELDRIEKDSITPSKAFVKWASNYSNNFGFDIQSVRGLLFKSLFKELDKIQIEVKSTDADNLSRYRFFVSKNEWQVANENISSYYFFCWAGINLEKETALHGPYIFPASSIMDLFPQDRSEESEWTECRFVIDLLKYSST